MVGPPSSSPASRGPFEREPDADEDGSIVDAERQAAAIIAAAELEAETRAQQILATAQTRLDAILNEERASHARLSRARDEVTETIAQLERGEHVVATPSAEPEPEPEHAPVEDPEVDEPPPSPKPRPTSMFPAAGSAELDLIDTIKDAIRNQVTQPT